MICNDYLSTFLKIVFGGFGGNCIELVFYFGHYSHFQKKKFCSGRIMEDLSDSYYFFNFLFFFNTWRQDFANEVGQSCLLFIY